MIVSEVNNQGDHFFSHMVGMRAGIADNNINFDLSGAECRASLGQHSTETTEVELGKRKCIVLNKRPSASRTRQVEPCFVECYEQVI